MLEGIAFVHRIGQLRFVGRERLDRSKLGTLVKQIDPFERLGTIFNLSGLAEQVLLELRPELVSVCCRQFILGIHIDT